MTDNDLVQHQQPPAEDKFGANWRKILPGLLVSGISLVVLIYLVDYRRLIQALMLADYRFVASVVVLTVIWLLVRTFVWRTLLQNQADFGSVFFTLNEGYLLNNLLPLRLGEIGRAYLLGRKVGIEFWRVLPTIIIERALDLFFAVGLLFSTLPFVVGADWAGKAAMGVGLVLLAVFALLYLAAQKREFVRRQFTHISRRFPLVGRIGNVILEPLLEGLGVLTNGRLFLGAVLWMALNWTVGIGQYYLMLRAFFPDGELLWAGFVLGVAALGVAAPSSPSAVGVLELSIVGALSIFGASASVALAMAFTLHINQILVTGIFGVYGLSRDGIGLHDLYQRATRLRTHSTK